MTMKNGIFALGILVFATLSHAETTSSEVTAPKATTSAKASSKKAGSDPGNYHVVPHATVKMTDVATLMKEFYGSKPQATKAASEANRKVAAANAAKIPVTEDLMTTPLKTFRNKLTAVKDAEALDKLLTEYDTNYDNADAAYPNDLKYVIARLSPLRSMRGFFWRMAPLAAKSTISQESLLGIVRSFAEQVMIYEPDTQWPAYIQYLAIPTAELLTPPTFDPKDGKKRTDRSFLVENDLPDFLAHEVVPALQNACSRLLLLQDHMEVTIDGKPSPVVFDNQIRFGQNAFPLNQYDATDRFKIVGNGELYAGIARFSRRIAMIAQLEAYNWNGNIALRSEIGRKMGINGAESTMSSAFTNLFNGAGAGAAANSAFTMDGITRKERILISKSHPEVFALRDKTMMHNAYFWLYNYAQFSQKAWNIIRDEPDNYAMLLDPDLTQGRHDQIDKSVRNLASLIPDPDKSGATPVAQGAITGKTIRVNLKGFFNSPPSNLHDLMPTGFARHEDLAGLEKVYTDGFTAPADDSVVKIKYGEQNVEWRNYLYGRATSWDVSKYSILFPDSKSGTDVAEAQKVLSETRGGRPILNTLVIFIK